MPHPEYIRSQRNSTSLESTFYLEWFVIQDFFSTTPFHLFLKFRHASAQFFRVPSFCLYFPANTRIFKSTSPIIHWSEFTPRVSMRTERSKKPIKLFGSIKKNIFSLSIKNCHKSYPRRNKESGNFNWISILFYSSFHRIYRKLNFVEEAWHFVGYGWPKIFLDNDKKFCHLNKIYDWNSLDWVS